MTILLSAGRAAANFLGRDSWLVRRLRPGYESLLGWSTAGHGIPWEINSVACRIDARHRYQMGSPYDASVASWLAQRVKPGQVTVDVGANVGVYVLQFAHWAGPTGKVIAIEPNPAARAVLEKHVRLNDLRARVEIVPAAVGAASGEATLFVADTDGMSRLGAPNPLIADRTIPIPVPVVTLDDLCEARGLVPDWLLLDIEGFEIAALSGARRLLSGQTKRPGVVVEMHPDSWAVAGTSRASAEALFRELGLCPEPLSGQTDPLGTHAHVWLRPA